MHSYLLKEIHGIFEMMNAGRNRCTRRYNLHKQKEPSFAHLKTFSDAHGNVRMTQEDGKSLTTVQMSMKRGLKMFHDAGVKGVRSEMRQLHERNVMKPVHERELTPEE
jgi:hypothetical protein